MGICRWDAYEQVGFYSERVEIVFRAVYDTSKDIAARAMAVQKRSIIHHIAERVSRPADTAPLYYSVCFKL